MDVAPLLLDLYGRIPPLANAAVEGLDVDALTWQPAPEANTIAWLVWHLARVQDHHVAELLGGEQVWADPAWPVRFGQRPDPENNGYGHSADEVRSVVPESADVLLDYLDAVDGVTRGFLEGLDPSRLDDIVDRRWDPPVTLGVRLVSIADDGLQHLGQAAYVRGLLPS